MTKIRIAVFVGLLVAAFSPLVVFGGGQAIILPMLLIFWLAGRV